jgi:uncharacterized protein
VSGAHVPLRTCVGCRGRAPKRELLRLALVDGRVRPDVKAVAPGRGAYVHRQRACVEAAIARGALAKALGTGLREDGEATLRTEIEKERER